MIIRNMRHHIVMSITFMNTHVAYALTFSIGSFYDHIMFLIHTRMYLHIHTAKLPTTNTDVLFAGDVEKLSPENLE